jgi:iron complex transport system substrate-binding protein
MPKLLRGLAFLLAVALAAGPATAQRTFEDSAGRVVAIPDRVEEVFAAGPPAAIVLFTLAPEKLLGWTRKPSPEEAEFLPEDYRDLPGLGRLTGRGNTVNLEVVVASDPDLVVDLGSVGPTYASLADRVQQQTGAPTILLGGRLDELPDAYRKLGPALGVAERAERLAATIETMLDGVYRRIAPLPPEDRPRVYYARGPEGLDTALTGSINVEALDFVRAENVAGEAIGRGGLATVSLEQVLAWNPDVIVTVDPTFYASVFDDPRWRGVAAVREGKVYLAPQYPFPWVDFPPSVNRVLGVRWLASVLYPDLFPEPIGPIARDFYALFYHRTLTDAELERLLATAAPDGAADR